MAGTSARVGTRPTEAGRSDRSARTRSCDCMDRRPKGPPEAALTGSVVDGAAQAVQPRRSRGHRTIAVSLKELGRRHTGKGRDEESVVEDEHLLEDEVRGVRFDAGYCGAERAIPERLTDRLARLRGPRVPVVGPGNGDRMRLARPAHGLGQPRIQVGEIDGHGCNRTEGPTIGSTASADIVCGGSLASVSENVPDRGDSVRGTSLLPTDLTEEELAAAPILLSADALLIKDLTADEDEAFAAALTS